MSSPTQQVVQKLWSFCHLLRDDGLSYADYLEQLTCLLFLKLAHEYAQPPNPRPSPIPAGYDWPSLLKRDGDALEAHYRHILETLGKKPGMLGLIFKKAQNKIQDPAKLRKLVADLIERESWRALDADVKGDAYEGLDDFVACYRPGHRHERKATWTPEAPTGLWRAYDYAEILQRDKVSLDISWLKDESLEDSESLPEPEVIAAEIADDLRAALEQFEEIEADLGRGP